ncbi:MAG: hypothetical protein Q8O03_04255 [Nanoarchaeota archaeon]|nr:hypothetical protein [Nanoarchaeota archaeon]
MGKIKNFAKRTAIATIIFGGYYLFYNQFDTSLIKSFSQKPTEQTVGIDFEAYKAEEPLGIKIVKKGEDLKTLEGKTIKNWTSLYTYSLIEWMKKSYSNTYGFTPYYGNFLEDDILSKGDEMINEIFNNMQKPNKLVLKIKGDKKYYEKIKADDPLTLITKKICKIASDKEDMVIIELESPDDGNTDLHNQRISYVKNINPNLKVAVTLDKKEGYDEKTKLWSPEKSKKYWENADIIILEDYFSSPSNLEKSIKQFKVTTKGKKQIWVRVVTGSQRINEKGIKSLEAEVEEYGQLLEVAYKNADGFLANDSNGIWLYSDGSYDKKERFDTTKMLYKKFRQIKINKS